MTSNVLDGTPEIQYLPVTKLKVRLDNPRRIKKSKFRTLCKNIKANPDYFRARPILLGPDYRIFAGTQRYLAAKKIGLKEVPVVIMDIPEDRQKQLMLLDNLHAGMFDLPKLELLGPELLQKVGLTKDDIPDLKIWTPQRTIVDDDFNDRVEAAKIKKPKTKPGDVIVLGDCMLVCGSSIDPAIVSVLKKILAKKSVSLIFCDPPYNEHGGVNYRRGFSGKRDYGDDVFDSRTDTEYAEFLRASMQNALAVSKPDVYILYFCAQVYIWLVQSLFSDLGLKNEGVAIWLKNSQNPIPSEMFGRVYEPCVVGRRGKPWLAPFVQDLNEVMNGSTTTGKDLITQVHDMVDVWAVPRLSSKEVVHATSKPPSVYQKAMRRSTKPNDYILDCFAGSFSSGIAGHLLGRRVIGIELSPVFCDLAALRFERVTGVKPKWIRV